MSGCPVLARKREAGACASTVTWIETSVRGRMREQAELAPRAYLSNTQISREGAGTWTLHRTPGAAQMTKTNAAGTLSRNHGRR
jgi:hypothetical protein